MHYPEQNSIAERYEYFGHTSVKRVRIYRGKKRVATWLHFNSVEEAMDFYYQECSDI